MKPIIDYLRLGGARIPVSGWSTQPSFYWTSLGVFDRVSARLWFARPPTGASEIVPVFACIDTTLKNDLDCIWSASDINLCRSLLEAKDDLLLKKQ